MPGWTDDMEPRRTDEAESADERPQVDLDQIGAVGPSVARAVGEWLRTTFASLSVRNFRLFFLGQGISLVGTWMRRTAMGWLVYQLTGSKALLGLIMGLGTIPMFVLSPLAGSIADRVDKRRMIILTQLGSTLCSGLVALLVFVDRVDVWSLAILSTATGVSFAFEIPARQAFIVELVGRDKLINAIALNSGLVNLSRIFGPALAGLVIGTVGMGFCFTIDALSYLVVIVMLLMLALPEFRKPESPGSHWQALLEGLREVHRNHRVRVLLLLLFLLCVFGWSFQTLMPAIAPDLLKLDATHYGVLMSMFGIGAIGGALFVASSNEESRRRFQVFGGVWAMVAGIYLIAFFGALLGARPAAFWCVSAALVLTGAGAVTFLSVANTLVQTSVEDGIRGRIMGIWALVFGGALPLGAFLAGVVAEVISPYLTISAFATVLLLGSLVVYRRLPRNHRGSRQGEPNHTGAHSNRM